MQLAESTILPPWLNREALRKAREARGISVSSEELEEIYARCKWYFHDVYYVDIYMTAAFRSSAENQVYLFMGKEYVLLNYAPSMHDFVIDGPNLSRRGGFVIDGRNLSRRGLRGLADARFEECEVTCAFGSHCVNHAFIFAGNSCAEITYSPPATKVDKIEDLTILKPTTDIKILKQNYISRMFPFLRRTRFVDGLNAAFESSTPFEAYIFKRDKCARINYHHRHGQLILLHYINRMFSCLRSTIFESGIDAAFASHRTEEAYLFKEGSCVLINYARDYLIGGVKNILEEWPSLNGIFPRKNNAHVSDSDEEDVDNDYYDDESSDAVYTVSDIYEETDSDDKNSDEIGAV